MRINKELCRQCTDRLAHHRDVVPVFRIRERALAEMEREALHLASQVAGRDASVERPHARRLTGVSELSIGEGVRARVYHSSGAITVKTDLAPFDALIADDVERFDAKDLEQVARRQAERINANRWAGEGERLAFERLWQIKATGMTNTGDRGRVALCRVVAAYRRYVNELPVWGRASVFVQVAGDNRIDSAGVDWRPIEPSPFDHVKVIAPDDAAAQLMADLQSRTPGSELSADDVDIAMFALGYFSLPKRRSQTALTPVYVAMASTRGWGTMNYLLVTSASEVQYESYCRVAQVPPPRESVKRQGKPSRIGTY
jgi:hypothetical protein